MDLQHEFDVSVPVESAWALFTDLSRVIPCLPGAGLDDTEEDRVLAHVKVKLGPVTAQYKGKAWYLEQDEAARKVVVRAEGREMRGQGNAKATIEVSLRASDAGTHADVRIDMAITGKVAQIGRGLIADVSAKLMGEFVRNLEAELGAQGSAGSSRGELPERAQAESTELALPIAEATETQPLDLLETAGAPLARRLLPLVGGVLFVLALIWLLAGRG